MHLGWACNPYALWFSLAHQYIINWDRFLFRQRSLDQRSVNLVRPSSAAKVHRHLDPAVAEDWLAVSVVAWARPEASMPEEVSPLYISTVSGEMYSCFPCVDQFTHSAVLVSWRRHLPPRWFHRSVGGKALDPIFLLLPHSLSSVPFVKF